MKLYTKIKTTLIAIAMPLALFVSPVNGAKENGYKAKVIAKYDMDGDRVIKGKEAELLRVDFQKEPEGWLSKLDKNHDGKLSDLEIRAIKPGKSTATGLESSN